MKKTVCLFLTFVLLVFSVYSQSIDRDYFKNNILDLDPIEGEYDMEVYAKGANAFVTFPENKVESSTVTIVKVG